MKTQSIALAALLAAFPMTAPAQESAARALAATCANCHGTNGRSATAEVMPLAGVPKEHIVAQMKAFKDGTRTGTIMHQLAKGYTDQQIDLVAGYFAAQKK